MELDFSALNSIAAKASQEDSSAFNVQPMHIHRLDIEKREMARAKEMYAAYQENVRASSELQAEILKGIEAGEDIYRLFLKTAKAISLMTSNSAFYSQAEMDIKAVYGIGLVKEVPIQMELQETQARLRRLMEAEEREEEASDSRRRIRRAIEAHMRRVKELERLIGAGG